MENFDTNVKSTLPWSYTNLLEENEKEDYGSSMPCTQKHQRAVFIWEK